MATPDTLKSTVVDAAQDIGEKARHGVHTTSARAQKGGEQAYEQIRFRLQKAQTAITIGSALLQGFLRFQEKQARKNVRKITHQARHAQSALQDRFQPTWTKNQELLQEGREAAQDTLQNSWEASQQALKQSAKRARKQIRKTQKNLKHLQEATQEQVESAWSRGQENLKSGWSATQDMVEDGSQQVRRSLTRVGSQAKDARKTMQKRYKRHQRKRARARMSFRCGLVLGVGLTLLFTPVTGAETRHRLVLFWRRCKQYLVKD